MRLAAHAKINLALEVLGTRPDGYHELRSVVAPIPLHDDVELADAPAGEVTAEMTGDGVEVPPVPNEANLAVRAARALAAATLAGRTNARTRTKERKATTSGPSVIISRRSTGFRAIASTPRPRAA